MGLISICNDDIYNMLRNTGHMDNMVVNHSDSALWSDISIADIEGCVALSPHIVNNIRHANNI